jgi:RNA polymerase primary sigma factor
MDRLSERERFVIEMRFGISREREHTLSEVAKELGVSLERVRQIQVRAINKMKTPGLRKAIDPFL